MVRETCLPRTFATVSYPSSPRPEVFRSQDSQEPQGSLGGVLNLSVNVPAIRFQEKTATASSALLGQ
jgi:hypothetical protein